MSEQFVAFSGGKDSTAMAYHLRELGRPRPNDGPRLTGLAEHNGMIFGTSGWPVMGLFSYDPTSAESYELLKTLNELNGLLLTHIGPLGAPMRSKFAEASLLADVLADFPDMPIIGAHMGFLIDFRINNAISWGHLTRRCLHETAWFSESVGATSSSRRRIVEAEAVSA